MSDEVKTPWSKRIISFIDRRFNGSFSAFLITLLGVLSIFLAGLFIYGLLNSVNVGDKVESTTTYSESSTVVPVYTHAKEGSDDFKKVIADLEFYNAKPEKTEVTRFVKTTVNRGTEVTYSLINNKSAESLYYHTQDGSSNFIKSLFKYLLEDSKEDVGTLIFYNKFEKTYTSKPIKGIKIQHNSSKVEVKHYYSRQYEGYQGAPKPVYSYSPTIELVAYKDGTYEWNSKDNWKLDNEAELQSYISSSPTKEN